MDNDLGKTNNRIQLLSDEEIIRMLTSDRDQYLKDALDFADEEAKKRGLKFDVSQIVESENKRDIQKKASLSGIGGWLIIVAIYVLIGPFIYLWSINELFPLLSDPSLFTIFTEFPFMRTSIIIENISNAVFFGFSIYIAIYFFKKDTRFPKMFIIFLSAAAIFGILDFFMLNTYEESYFLGFEHLLRGLGNAAIWIIYMKRSKRVKSTFVN